MTSGLGKEIQAFRIQKKEEIDRAFETAALFILGGIDRDAAFSASCEGKKRITAKLERLIERERLRGMRRHWSYDLNRHIALKQALDRLRSLSPA